MRSRSPECSLSLGSEVCKKEHFHPNSKSECWAITAGASRSCASWRWRHVLRMPGIQRCGKETYFISSTRFPDLTPSICRENYYHFKAGPMRWSPTSSTPPWTKSKSNISTSSTTSPKTKPNPFITALNSAAAIVPSPFSLAPTTASSLHSLLTPCSID